MKPRSTGLMLMCVAALLGAGPALQSEQRPVVRFEDATDKLGLSGLPQHEAAWVDFDNDGWVDLYLPGQLWRNEQGRRFVRVADVKLSGKGIWGDYDSDGYLDLYCWDGRQGRLFRNLAGKGFKDESDKLPASGIVDSRGAVWGDLDGDGFLDLYVGGYEGGGNQPDVIYLNTGDGGFKLHWKTPGNHLPARGVIAADFDEDGDLDIYVSNYRLVRNLLWLNDGKATFTSVAGEYGVAGDGGLGAWGHTIGSAWGDLDNDGHLDLLAGNFSHKPAYQDRPKFYRNLGPEGRFRFRDMSKQVALGWQESFASPCFGDFDNDGLLDLFFTTVYPHNHCVLVRNDGDWKFTDVTARAGLKLKQTYQNAYADFDNDGDLDLVSGGRLWRNTLGVGHHWLKVRLEGDGRKVNRAAIGTQVRIRLGRATLTRQVGGFANEFSQSDMTVHFGLGQHAKPVTLHIRWTDGTTQQLTTPVDRTVTVRYGEKTASDPVGSASELPAATVDPQPRRGARG